MPTELAHMSITKTYTDEELLELLLKEETRGQYLMYKKYYGYLLSVCMRYTSCKEDAEEIVNESFFKIFKNLDQYKGDGSLIGWMYKIVVFTAIDHTRKYTKYRKVFFPGIIPDQPIQNTAIDQMSAEELLELLQGLPDASRTVFSLFVLEGYSHKEIAVLLKISVGTSKWHLNNARKLLQNAIGNKSRN